MLFVTTYAAAFLVFVAGAVAMLRARGTSVWVSRVVVFGVMFLVSIVGLVLGIVVTLDRRGLMWFRRWTIVGKFYLRRALKRDDVIDATALYEVVELREQPIVIRKAGKTIVTTSQTDRDTQ